MGKYRNKKITLFGRVFDSKREAEDFLLLMSRARKKEIHSLACQVPISLCRNGASKRKYIADFAYYDKIAGSWVIMDSKGMKIEPYQTKRDWLLDNYTGFIFIEKTAEKEKTFKPAGDIQLDFDKLLCEGGK